MLSLSNSKPLRVRSLTELIVRLVALTAVIALLARRAYVDFQTHAPVMGCLFGFLAVMCAAAAIEVSGALLKHQQSRAV